MNNLHLSSTDSMIGGVCGGLSETLGIDPTIIRLIWAASFFLWGVGGILYLLCWTIFPED
jgi:phage shock protein C